MAGTPPPAVIHTSYLGGQLSVPVISGGMSRTHRAQVISLQTFNLGGPETIVLQGFIRVSIILGVPMLFLSTGFLFPLPLTAGGDSGAGG